MVKNILNKNKSNVISNKNQKSVSVQLEKKFFSIPYVKNLFDKVKAVFKNTNCVVCFKNNNTLSKMYTKVKSETPFEKQCNLVYTIPCGVCSKEYIGQTERYITTRISEHKRDQKSENLVYNNQKTSLTSHAYEFLHQFDFDNARILGKQANKKKRLMLESLEIQKSKNAVNNRTDIENLNKSYFNIISKL